MLPNGRGITVHASYKGHDFVTVGDVLDALDMMLLEKPSRELSSPVAGSHDAVEGTCRSLGVSTVLHVLRSQHVRAGLTRSDEGLDIWELRVG